MYKFRTQYDEQNEVCVEHSHEFPSLVEPGAHGVDIPTMLEMFDRTKDFNILGLTGNETVMSEEEQQEFLRSDSALTDPTADAIDVLAELQEQQGLDSIRVQESGSLFPTAEQNIAQQSKMADAEAKGFEQGVDKSPKDD